RAAWIAGGRGRCCGYASVHRRRPVEVEHVLQRGRVLVTRGQVRARPSLAGEAEEALFDEGEQRGVIAHGVRHVARLGERRHRDERHAEAELIEVRATCWVRARSREPWTDRRRIGLADRALLT